MSVPPCSKVNCNINFNIKRFHQNKGCGTTPAEPHIRNVNKGRRPGGGRGVMCPDHPRNRCELFPPLSTSKFCHLLKTLLKPFNPMTTIIPNKSKIKPKRHLNCLILRQPGKHTFLLAHHRWGTFRKEECLQLSNRNSILMT